MVSPMARPTSTQLSILDDIALMDAREDPPIGYPPVIAAFCTMPGQKPPQDLRVWSRETNGRRWTITAGTNLEDGSSVGLPYGPKARLWLAFLGGYAKKHQTPVIELGPSLNGFMAEFGVYGNGGRNGSKPLVGEQIRRLVRSQLEFGATEDMPRYHRDHGGGMRFARHWDLWWDRSENPTHPVDGSYIILSDDFYREIDESSFPLNLDALRILGGSALAMDLYAWLTYRLRTVTRPTTVTWQQLAVQFGKAELAEAGRRRTLAISETKRNIRAQMGTVLAVYHQAKVEDTDAGLVLRQSQPHVPERGLHGIRRAQAVVTLPARRMAAAAADRTRAPIKVEATLGDQPALPAGSPG